MSEMQKQVADPVPNPQGSGPSAEQVAEWQASIKPADREFCAWVAFQADAQRKGGDVCRAAASTLVAVLALFFAGYVAFLRLAPPATPSARLITLLPLVPWTVAGGALVWYMLPQEWTSVPGDGDGIRREYLRFVVRRKRNLWRIAGVVLGGMALAFYVFVRY